MDETENCIELQLKNEKGIFATLKVDKTVTYEDLLDCVPKTFYTKNFQKLLLPDNIKETDRCVNNTIKLIEFKETIIYNTKKPFILYREDGVFHKTTSLKDVNSPYVGMISMQKQGKEQFMYLKKVNFVMVLHTLLIKMSDKIDLKSIGTLRYLTTLYITNSVVDSDTWDDLKHLQELKHVNFEHTVIKDLTKVPFIHWKSLEKLVIAYCSIVNFSSYIWYLNNLKHLDISSNTYLQDIKLPKEPKCLPIITFKNLSMSSRDKVSPIFFQNVRKLYIMEHLCDPFLKLPLKKLVYRGIRLYTILKFDCLKTVRVLDMGSAFDHANQDEQEKFISIVRENYNLINFSHSYYMRRHPLLREVLEMVERNRKVLEWKRTTCLYTLLCCRFGRFPLSSVKLGKDIGYYLSKMIYEIVWQEIKP